MSLWVIQPAGQPGNRLATFAHLIAFGICLNEPLPANQFDGLDTTPGLGSIAEDQYTLSRCDYILGPLFPAMFPHAHFPQTLRPNH